MQFRDFWALLLTILSAPFFILIYYLMTGGSSTTYSLNYFVADRDSSSIIRDHLVNELKAVKYTNGENALAVSEIYDTLTIKDLIKNRKVDLLLTIPQGFTDSLKKGNPPEFIIYGEASNPKYTIGTIFTVTAIESLVKKLTSNKPLYTFQEKFMGNSISKSEFDIYAPEYLSFQL